MFSLRTARPAQSVLRSVASSSSCLSRASGGVRCMATVQSDIFKPTKYGGKYTVTLIPGDGIGVEVAESVKTIFKADNVPIEWEQVDVSGVDSGNKHSEDLFRESIASLRRNKLGLKGILHTPIERSGHQSFNVALRQELDIYASIVLIKNIPGYQTRHDNVDLCIIRENTEGEYSGLEHQPVNGVVESLKIITRAKSERIAKFAFSFALANNRKKVTYVAVFEPGCRHVGLDIQGKDQANPTALILSGSMLLRHLGLDDHANRISKAVYDVIGEGAVRTRDMGGRATTHEFTRAVLDKMEAQL
ncbi:isocitrate dehydrogenase subunit 1 [Arthroderma uncinatum]|uniref:isocitrate dehydrogenase subunit 1 n=1 Tax=Arthroderma uncinatum TaxID=74035 RepID=UPI00144ABE09|nr:isocitrate dehydrogenase subunit 1 [Arthroderma uncinatum]KAF3481719.1 isocitrate dehydrogenase subunit 1 [Arthroderma uncinatum]